MPDDAFDIANRFLDSGAKRNELEVAILLHMEHHIAVEREACAKIAESLKTLKASLPVGPNGEHETEHPTIHGEAIAKAIRDRTPR